MDIKLLRNNPDFVKQNQQNRYNDTHIIDEILELDKQWRDVNNRNNNVSKWRNTCQRSIRFANNEQLLLQDPEEFAIELISNDNANKDILTTCTKEYIIETMSYLSKQGDILTKEEAQLLEKRNEKLNLLGNILHDSVVIDNNEDNNKVIEVKQNYVNVYNKYNHVELCDKLNIVDYKGTNIMGNRGYFLKNFGVRLNYALLNYALDFMQERNYQMMYTPHMMNHDIMSKVAQLSEYDETLYKLDGLNKYMIATSEQPLTGYFLNKRLRKKELPIRIGGISTCYRKESGSHGKDTLGIFRVHQFEKVEQFCITDNKSSWEMHENMLNIAKEFYNSLGISYRIVSIVSGALNNSASKKYDIEGYFPHSKTYRELVSCTNTTDYMSRRLMCKDESGEYVHMLNSTLYANTRTICCLLETYQTQDGFRVPDVLVKYLNETEIKFA